MTLLVADMDLLRLYNRFYGLKGGNDLLRKLGKKLGEKHPRIFRHGEDEFVVLLMGSSAEKAREAALDIRQTLEELTSRSAFPLSAAVGYAVAEPPYREPRAVLNAAFCALTQTKGRTPHVSEAVANEESRAERNTSSEGDTELAGAVAILVQAVEARDSYGGNHPRSASRLALRLGSKVGLARPHLDTLAVGALLHDVGKIGIPDSILLKPDRLTDGEYEIVERHSLLVLWHTFVAR